MVKVQDQSEDHHLPYRYLPTFSSSPYIPIHPKTPRSGHNLAMSSLASQLQSIASIDASRLTSRGGHPSSKSYLFPPKDAATHDLDAIYALGISGFEEVVSLDPEFQQFEDELFSENAKGNDRMMLNAEENQQLDEVLGRCLRRLGRWIGLMAGGKCIEWLVRRFR
jgi:U3 small nucleolar RNA-associated protein 10